MVLNSLVVSLIPVAILSLQVFFMLDIATVMMMVIVEVAVMSMVVLIDTAMPQDNYLKIKPNHQSQLDTDGQGVLRNIGLTSARLLIAGAVTICLNMIIKVDPT